MPSHQGNQVLLGTWLMHSSQPGHLIVGSGWPRLMALAGVLIFLVSLIALRRTLSTPAKLTGAKQLLGVLLLSLYLVAFAAAITLLFAAILPHGVPVSPCNTCGGE